MQEALKATLVATLGVGVEELQPHAHLVNDLGLDSLDGIEMISAVEEAFKIQISDEEAHRVKTYGELEELVARLTSTPAAV